MKNMTLETLATVCGGTLYYGEEKAKREVEGVVLDSRLVEKDYLFLATKGERVDGHRFIPDVFEKGALAVVCEVLPEEPLGPCILVRDSFRALTDMAAFYRSNLNVKIVGITGSVGKTSTKEFIAGVLSQRFSVLKTSGNFNNEVGVPLTLLRIREEHEIAVVEMGINHFGEMQRLSRLVKPDVAVMTNIGMCHLENLEDRDGVLRAKSEIFEHMNPEGIVVVNGDDDKLCSIAKVHGKKPIRFGLKETDGLDYFTDDIENKGLLGSRFVICDKAGNRKEAEVPLPGVHMIYNALAATAVGKHFGMQEDEIVKGLKECRAVSGRSNIIVLPGATVIDDCYNANPTSMKAAIDLLTTAMTAKVAILGDMFELGEEENSLHREIGVYAAEKKIDLLLCVGALSRNMYEGAKEASEGVYYFATRDECMEALEELVPGGSSILVKASHGMAFDAIVKKLEDIFG
ncbi:MAG: UDP-N-acetylmuramoyl-tripeptide--D-alanyl-D-alanine ligase [Lachnospiraceae bacterium]|nr:UDP-N-acetylmuramoyl-tripeptide--D-alanyl-D-alanine ligase [Lachnospiraceae bacterium]MBQ8262921.1 UDP-N-acetylmuramoyl-tripeptide--D-alanyl-D-alanine ligase [Lachnospiraceae bacterium]